LDEMKPGEIERLQHAPGNRELGEWNKEIRFFT
jgi:hypothetical protein